jgi:hypothetical protein
MGVSDRPCNRVTFIQKKKTDLGPRCAAIFGHFEGFTVLLARGGFTAVWIEEWW